MLGSAIAMSDIVCKVYRLRTSEFPSRERGTEISLENRSGERGGERLYHCSFFWLLLIIGLSILPTHI